MTNQTRAKRILIVTTQVPFVRGGAELLAEALKAALQSHGYIADIVALPFKWYPAESLLDSIMSARMVDLTESAGQKIDRIITLKFPAYLIEHPNKVCWLLHQHRQAYDLYETEFGDLHQTEMGQKVTSEIKRLDNQLIPQHKAIYTIANNVTRRLWENNGIAAKTLYPPPLNMDLFKAGEFQNYILAPGRLDATKRQHLIVEAMRTAPKHLKLILIGPDDTPYGESLKNQVAALNLSDQVEMRGMVSEHEKIELYANCAAVYNGVYDEDYGYLTLEAFLSEKPVLVYEDAGGPLEFVTHLENGWIIPPTIEATSAWLQHFERDKCPDLGKSGSTTLHAKGINWDVVVTALTEGL